MTNQPWECPRCRRMNAPHNPTCFCRPGQESALERIINDPGAKGQGEFRPMELPAGLPYGYKRTGTCSNCGGHHGDWNGRPVECMNLAVKA